MAWTGTTHKGFMMKFSTLTAAAHIGLMFTIKSHLKHAAPHLPTAFDFHLLLKVLTTYWHFHWKLLNWRTSKDSNIMKRLNKDVRPMDMKYIILPHDSLRPIFELSRNALSHWQDYKKMEWLSLQYKDFFNLISLKTYKNIYHNIYINTYIHTVTHLNIHTHIS
jgi:hypothetical protein